MEDRSLRSLKEPSISKSCLEARRGSTHASVHHKLQEQELKELVSLDEPEKYAFC
jgi:hypothetical protein